MVVEATVQVGAQVVYHHDPSLTTQPITLTATVLTLTKMGITVSKSDSKPATDSSSVTVRLPG